MNYFSELLAPNDPQAQRRAWAVLLAGTCLTLAGFAGVYFSPAAKWVVFFDNFHWTAAYLTAAGLAWIGYRSSPPEWRAPRQCFAITFAGYAFGQVLWDVQVAIGWNPFPGPSDFFYVWLGIGSAIGLWTALKLQADRSQLRTALLDIATASVAVLLLTLALYLPRQGNTGLWSMTMLVAYPVAILTAACIGLLLVPTLRLRPDFGWVLFLISLFIQGGNWMLWNSLTLDNALQNGSVFNVFFSVTTIASGLGAMCWRAPVSRNPARERRSEWLLRLVPLLAVLCSATAVVLSFTIPNTPDTVQFTACAGAVLVSLLAMIRQSLLLQERDRLIEAEEQLIENQANYKTLFDTAQDAIIIMQDGAAVDCNASALKLYGCTREQLIGRRPSDFSPEFQPDGRRSDEQANALIAAAMAGEPQRFEWRNRTFSGEDLLVEVRLSRLERGGHTCLQIIVRDVTARKKMELALRESEERFRTLVDQASDAIYVHDVNGRLLDVNQSACKDLGYSREELLRLSVFDVEQGVKPDELLQLWRSLKPGSSVIVRGQQQRRDGSIFPVEASLAGCMIQGRMIIAVTTRNITQRLEYEDRIAQSVSLLRATIESGASGLVVVDNDGRVTIYNNRFLEIWGISPETAAGSNDTDLLKQAVDQLVEPEGFLRRIREIYQHPEQDSLDTLFLKDGRVLNRVSRPQRLGDKVIGRVWSFRDVTSQYHAEQSMRLQSVALKAAANAIVITDQQGRIEWVNPAFTRSTGYALDEALGKNPRDLVRSGRQSREFFAQMWQTILAGNVWNGELTNRRKDGSLFIEEMIITPLTNPEGQVTHFVAIKQDITRRKQLENELRQASERTQFYMSRMPLAFIAWDQDFRAAEWNPAAEKIFGWSAADAIGRNAYDFLVPANIQPQTAKVWQDVFRGGSLASHYINDNLTRDGRRITCEWRSTPLAECQRRNLRLPLHRRGHHRTHQKRKTTGRARKPAASGAKNGGGRPAVRRHRP